MAQDEQLGRYTHLLSERAKVIVAYIGIGESGPLRSHFILPLVLKVSTFHITYRQTILPLKERASMLDAVIYYVLGEFRTDGTICCSCWTIAVRQ